MAGLRKWATSRPPGRTLGTVHDLMVSGHDEVQLIAPTGHKSHLREKLVGLDALALLVAWSLALFVLARANRDLLQTSLVVLGTTALGLWLLSVQELYLARVSAIRSVELSRLTRTAILAAVGEILLTRVFHVPSRLTEALIGGLLSLVFLVTGRSVFRAYLAQCRRNGRFCRHVVIVGASAEAADIVELIATHPEAGFRVDGVVGDRGAALANGMAGQWLGPVENTFEVLDEHHTGGVIVVAGAIPAQQLSGVVRGLQERNIHIQLSSGLRGIDFRRLRGQPHRLRAALLPGGPGPGPAPDRPQAVHRHDPGRARAHPGLADLPADLDPHQDRGPRPAVLQAGAHRAPRQARSPSTSSGRWSSTPRPA